LRKGKSIIFYSIGKTINTIYIFFYFLVRFHFLSERIASMCSWGTLYFVYALSSSSMEFRFMHWSMLQPIVAAHKDITFLLIHFSTRYNDVELRTFAQSTQEKKCSFGNVINIGMICKYKIQKWCHFVGKYNILSFIKTQKNMGYHFPSIWLVLIIVPWGGEKCKR
jgi:hypothetical protein